MIKHKKFSIIIPVLNEENLLKKSIDNLIRKLKCNFNNKKYKWEVIIIENGSRDNSWNICQKLVIDNPNIVKIFKLKEANYGSALKKGILESSNDYVVIFNVDYWDIDFLRKGLFLIENNDIVVGSKTLIASQDMRSFFRKQVSYWFNVFLRTIYNFQGTDTHGIKIMNREKVSKLLKSCYGLSELLDTQIVLHACKHSLIYTEIPVKVREVRRSRYALVRRVFNVTKDLVIIFKSRYL